MRQALLPLIQPPLLREHRLYQADWLLRFYGFTADEIATGATAGHLDLDLDPKLAWALQHRGQFPLDVNTAPQRDAAAGAGLWHQDGGPHPDRAPQPQLCVTRIWCASARR